MFRQFRKIEAGEFFVIGGDCSQGGADQNFCHFMSKTKLDIPLVWQKSGVAAEMTEAVYPMLNRLFDVTGVMPVVCFERNNGGASEMERLNNLNRDKKYIVFVMPAIGDKDPTKTTNKLGWDTNVATRPIMLGDWKNTFDNRVVVIYDEETIKQHKTFIINQRGKPEAAKSKRDDAVMSLAVTWQLFQRCLPTRVIKTGGLPYDTEHRPFGVYNFDAYQ